MTGQRASAGRIASAALLLALTACADKGYQERTAEILVTATDTSCNLSRTTATAGSLTFQVVNSGTKVTEFYVYSNGDRVVGEVENVAPGTTRSLIVDLSSPGSYQTACKPGMVAGQGIRSTFTVLQAPSR
jgi:iron uptake system component EfeO